MQLTPDYLISECGCPQVASATEYSTSLKENCFSGIKLRYHNYITSSKRRLLPRRESLSDYYDKLIINSAVPRTTVVSSTDFVKSQLLVESDTLKHMKCAMNEAIRKADKQCCRSQQSANNVDSNKKHYR